MKFGFIPTEGGHYYQEFFAEAVLGEELGFDSVWLEEHHGVENHYWPSPLIGLAALADRTDQIMLGTDIAILPFYHPVRLAEDVAMLDGISQGRFILGAAIGYRPDEFALFATSMEKRGERYEESVQLILKLWTEESVTFSGKHFDVREVKIEPRPVTQPHPPLWLGGWGPLALARAARWGDAWVPGPTANLEKLLSAQKTYHEECIKAGKPPGTSPTPLTREVVIAATDAEANQIAEKHLLISYRDEYGGGTWQHPLIGKEDTTQVSRLEEIGRDRFIIGNPETVIRKIQTFQDTFGVDHLICRLYFPGISHEFIQKELFLLAREVIPAFR